MKRFNLENCGTIVSFAAVRNNPQISAFGSSQHLTYVTYVTWLQAGLCGMALYFFFFWDLG